MPDHVARDAGSPGDPTQELVALRRLGCGQGDPRAGVGFHRRDHRGVAKDGEGDGKGAAQGRNVAVDEAVAAVDAGMGGVALGGLGGRRHHVLVAAVLRCRLAADVADVIVGAVVVGRAGSALIVVLAGGGNHCVGQADLILPLGVGEILAADRAAPILRVAVGAAGGGHRFVVLQLMSVVRCYRVGVIRRAGGLALPEEHAPIVCVGGGVPIVAGGIAQGVSGVNQGGDQELALVAVRVLGDSPLGVRRNHIHRVQAAAGVVDIDPVRAGGLNGIGRGGIAVLKDEDVGQRHVRHYAAVRDGRACGGDLRLVLVVLVLLALGDRGQDIAVGGLAGADDVAALDLIRGLRHQAEELAVVALKAPEHGVKRGILRQGVLLPGEIVVGRLLRLQQGGSVPADKAVVLGEVGVLDRAGKLDGIVEVTGHAALVFPVGHKMDRDLGSGRKVDLDGAVRAGIHRDGVPVDHKLRRAAEHLGGLHVIALDGFRQDGAAIDGNAAPGGIVDAGGDGVAQLLRLGSRFVLGVVACEDLEVGGIADAGDVEAVGDVLAPDALLGDQLLHRGAAVQQRQLGDPVLILDGHNDLRAVSNGGEDHGGGIVHVEVIAHQGALAQDVILQHPCKAGACQHTGGNCVQILINLHGVVFGDRVIAEADPVSLSSSCEMDRGSA